jgi:membrane protein DedA with SNARE-associated domain
MSPVVDHQLPGIVGTLAPVLDRYGYLAVAGLVFVESFGIPAPGQTILIAAGVYAGTGQLNVFLVGVLGILAAVVGDSLGYLIGRLGGRRLVLRFGRYVFVNERRLDKLEGFFDRHGAKIVASARFVDGARQLNGVVAGLVRMPWPRFLFFNALGAVLWAGIWTTVGYLAGSHVDAIYERFRQYELYLLIGLGCLVAVLLAYFLWRHSRAR